jgi:hypothetical protein
MFLELTESNLSLQVHAVFYTVRYEVRLGFKWLLSFEFTADTTLFIPLFIAVSKTWLILII